MQSRMRRRKRRGRLRLGYRGREQVKDKISLNYMGKVKAFSSS